MLGELGVQSLRRSFVEVTGVGQTGRGANPNKAGPAVTVTVTTALVHTLLVSDQREMQRKEDECGGLGERDCDG